MLFIRYILPYQDENTTNVLINQTPFNQSTLTHFNYTLYSNGTLSNTTQCYLTFNSFHPHLFSNGSFVNATSCYSPINEIRTHASLGLAFALLYALTIIFSLVNIRKHSRRYLPLDRRYSTFSRVVKYYWFLAVAVLAAISCFMGVDVDRDYLQSDPLILQSIFYMFVTPTLMASVWEAVRHWSTWQKRQIHDRDPYAFTFSPPSTQTYQENTLPLLFYALALTSLLLSILRPWAQIPLQRSPEQQALIAEPVATDPRFKGAGYASLACWMVILYSVLHSIHRSLPAESKSKRGKLVSSLKCVPPRLAFVMVLLAVKVSYVLASAYDFSISPMRYNVHPAVLYGLGHAPGLLIICVLDVCGFSDLNEDKALLVLRAERDDAFVFGKEEQLRAFVREVEGRSLNSSGNGNNGSEGYEMGDLRDKNEDAGASEYA